MNKIIEIYMKRDGMSTQEAVEAYKELRQAVYEAIENGEYDEAEEIMLDEGFEMDYAFDIV